MSLTVSGLNKRYAVPYLLWKYGGGSNPDIEQACKCYMSNNNIKFEESSLTSPFIQIARLAYRGDKSCMAYIKSLSLDYLPIFYYFGDGLYVPAGHTGKQTLDYIDEEFTAICTDYLGQPVLTTESSAVYMEPQSYLMSQTSDYLRFLSGIQEVIY